MNNRGLNNYKYFKGTKNDFETWLQNLKLNDPRSYEEAYKSIIFIHPNAGSENMTPTYDPTDPTKIIGYTFTGDVTNSGWMYANGSLYSNSAATSMDWIELQDPTP